MHFGIPHLDALFLGRCIWGLWQRSSSVVLTRPPYEARKGSHWRHFPLFLTLMRSQHFSAPSPLVPVLPSPPGPRKVTEEALVWSFLNTIAHIWDDPTPVLIISPMSSAPFHGRNNQGGVGAPTGCDILLTFAVIRLQHYFQLGSFWLQWLLWQFRSLSSSA